ncbi:MAG: adenylosuccinate synthase [Bacteroidaceae bacterium]|nr:adenylosuccinate synthase [Bacteroidaceae bacterium]
MANKGKVDALLGIVFGDEGKGKIVDWLAPRYDVVARFAGGPNAGHTIIFGGRKFVLRSIPSGVFDEGKLNVIGNGCVIAPDLFMAEARELEAAGYTLAERLVISRRAHLILPTHRVLDRAYEAAKGKDAVGTTGKGIGPAYSDKAARTGLRVGDIEEDFEAKYRQLKARHEQILADLGFTSYDIAQEEALWLEGVDYMRRFRLADTEAEVNRLLSEGKHVLAEGAQGSLLDIDHGTYPFVSSSSTTAGGVCTGLGVAPGKIDRVWGVFKAYSTRVGAGPFPVELFDATGDTLRDIGHEYGAVTGRNRRCGWLDLVALKYAIMVNGVTDLVMMKSDVLDTFPVIKVCTAYRKGDAVTSTLPYDLTGWEAVYEELPGWQTPTDGLRREEDFPKAFRNYIAYVERAVGVPISIVSVSPDRDATIVRRAAAAMANP